MSWTKSGVSHYKVTIREPGWERSTMLWEKFSTSKEAEDYIKEMAGTFPEDTMFWVTSIWSKPTRWAPQGMTSRKSFIVNEYGEAVPRKGKWIPEGMVPREWVKRFPEVPPEPEEPEIIKGLTGEETSNLRRLLSRMGGVEEDQEISEYTRELERRERFKDVGDWPYYKPEDLE